MNKNRQINFIKLFILTGLSFRPFSGGIYFKIVYILRSTGSQMLGLEFMLWELNIFYDIFIL